MNGLAIAAIVAGSIAAYALIVGLFRGIIGEERWDGASGDPIWQLAVVMWPITFVVAPPIWLGLKVARGAADFGIWIVERRREKRAARKLPRAEVHRGR